MWGRRTRACLAARQAAPNYVYSAALKASSVAWDEKSLSRWLADPEKFIPGQKMGVSVEDANERQDLIAYLKTLSGQ